MQTTPSKPRNEVQEIMDKMNPQEQRRFLLSAEAVRRFGEGAYKPAVTMLRANPEMPEADFWKEIEANL